MVFSGVPAGMDEAKVHLDLQGEWHVNKAFVDFACGDAPKYTACLPTLPPGKKIGDAAAGTDREDYL